MMKNYKYDVAISFAEEDRNAALALSLAFEIEGFKNVYYYPDKQVDDLGDEFKKSLTKIYRDEAKYAIVLFSDQYFGPHKVFTSVELEAIKVRMVAESNHVYMIPVILNESFHFQDPILSKLKCYPWNYNPKPLAR